MQDQPENTGLEGEQNTFDSLWKNVERTLSLEELEKEEREANLKEQLRKVKQFQEQLMQKLKLVQ